MTTLYFSHDRSSNHYKGIHSTVQYINTDLVAESINKIWLERNIESQVRQSRSAGKRVPLLATIVFS